MAAGSLRREVPRAFVPLLKPARYKGAWGGRGSGKTHFFGEQTIVECIAHPGTRVLCIREVQNTLAESSKKIIETKIQAMGVGHLFEVQKHQIITPGDGLISFVGMKDHNAESIKSMEGFRIAWVEEAQTLSGLSLSLLRPTIRAPGSQIWFSWNPTRKLDAVDQFLRGPEPLPDAIVVNANWKHNPWFPEELEGERQLDLQLYPDRYDHIWEGGYAKAFEGAYFAKVLLDARTEGRVGVVARDPLLPVRAYFDIGGAGASADAMAIWLVQFVGHQIRVLDYIEGQAQVLAYYVNELRKRGYGDDTMIFLPHDGVNTNNITGKRYEDHLREAGFGNVVSIPNMGRGAAALRIEAVRRVFPQIWFNAGNCEAGLDALGFYHERKDEKRGVGLGPEHDWSSHGADAFGLMAVDYEAPRVKKALKLDRSWVV
jgi:phage terminase large subunit